MNKIYKTNYFHRFFLGWLAGEIDSGRVSPTREIADMAPIELSVNRDLFAQFLREENLVESWGELELEHGTIQILTYFNARD